MFKIKKLALNAETIRLLSGGQLRLAAGGGYYVKNTMQGPNGGDCSYTDHNQREPCPSDAPTYCQGPACGTGYTDICA